MVQHFLKEFIEERNSTEQRHIPIEKFNIEQFEYFIIHIKQSEHLTRNGDRCKDHVCSWLSPRYFLMKKKSLHISLVIVGALLLSHS